MGIYPSVFLILMSIAVSGCAPVALFSAGAGTLDAATKEKGIKGTVSDAEIRTKINLSWFDHSPRMHRALDLEVQEGRVLMAGVLPNEKAKMEAIRLVWNVDGVKDIIDEVRIAKKNQTNTYLRDKWISTQISSALIFDPKVCSSNYSISTINQIVYVMGVAQNREELQHVLEKARHVADVREVKSYVRLKNEPLVDRRPQKGK